jgi:hypothetical protein
MTWAVIYGAAGFFGAFLGTLAGGWVNTRVILRRLRLANAKLPPQDWDRMMKRWTEPPGG